MDYWTSNGIIINHWLWMTLFTLAWPTWPLTVPADALSVWVVDGSSLILQHRVNTSLVVSFFSVPNCSHFRYFLKHQTTEQYSRRGRTYVVKALTRLLISRERKHFKIRFVILCPITVTLAICFENLTPLFMVTPKSTNSCTVAKTQLSTVYVTSGEWWRSRIQHLLYKIGNCQVCDHSTIRFKSSCNECGLVRHSDGYRRSEMCDCDRTRPHCGLGHGGETWPNMDSIRMTSPNTDHWVQFQTDTFARYTDSTDWTNRPVVRRRAWLHVFRDDERVCCSQKTTGSAVAAAVASGHDDDVCRPSSAAISE